MIVLTFASSVKNETPPSVPAAILCFPSARAPKRRSDKCPRQVLRINLAFGLSSGTFVPLPTPSRGRRMPARNSPEGRRGQPARQYPSNINATLSAAESYRPHSHLARTIRGAWKAFRLSGQDPLAVRAGKKLRNDELLVTVLAGTVLSYAAGSGAAVARGPRYR
jgi:hypothetical protein